MTRSLAIKLTVEDRELVQRASEAAGQPAGAWAAAAVLEAAVRLLALTRVPTPEPQQKPPRKRKRQRPEHVLRQPPEEQPSTAWGSVLTHPSYDAYRLARDGGIGPGGLPRCRPSRSRRPRRRVSRGAHLDLHAWRGRHWTPAVRAAGLPHRPPYALRHTFASLSIAAGISLFELARHMGTSVEQIDATYGHLLPDSLDRARAALERFVAASAEREEGEAEGLGHDWAT